jgi:hypothetical protein
MVHLYGQTLFPDTEGTLRGLKLNFRSTLASSYTENPKPRYTQLQRPEPARMGDEFHPIGRVETPNEVAKGILFFAADDSSWPTGSILNIDWRCLQDRFLRFYQSNLINIKSNK